MDFSALSDFIISKMAETGMPGLSIAVIDRGEVVFARGFGYRDIDLGEPATPRTVYGIGSVTKSFTALAIMQLAEKGRLDLNDPVSKYVPLKLKVKNEEVTIHHLLTHTSGIPALGYAEALINGYLEIGGTWLPTSKPEDVIDFLRGAEEWAVGKPGERFYYLNEGYVLLGKIIEKASSKSYETYIKENILQPLGMTRTYISRNDVAKDEDVATPYIVSKRGKVRKGKFPYGIVADGGLLSNVIDLAKYISMYLNRGELGGVRIVSKESIEIMEKVHIKLPYTLFGNEGYGYGLMVYPDFLGTGHKLVCHSGSVLVYTAFIGYVPERNIGVAILANSSGYPLSNIGMYVIAELLGKDPRKDLPFIRNEEILKRLVGTYRGFKNTIRVEVRLEGDFLYVIESIDGKEVRVPLIPVDLREDYAKFYTLVNFRKVPVEFLVRESCIELLYERYKLVKCNI